MIWIEAQRSADHHMRAKKEFEQISKHGSQRKTRTDKSDLFRAVIKH
jgi:hypothetical protein